MIFYHLPKLLSHLFSQMNPWFPELHTVYMLDHNQEEQCPHTNMIKTTLYVQFYWNYHTIEQEQHHQLLVGGSLTPN